MTDAWEYWESVQEEPSREEFEIAVGRVAEEHPDAPDFWEIVAFQGLPF